MCICRWREEEEKWEELEGEGRGGVGGDAAARGGMGMVAGSWFCVRTLPMKGQERSFQPWKMRTLSLGSAARASRRSATACRVDRANHR